MSHPVVIMGPMTTALWIAVAVGLTAAVTYLLVRYHQQVVDADQLAAADQTTAAADARFTAAVEQAVASVTQQLHGHAVQERDAAIKAALEQGVVLQRQHLEQLSARQREQLGAKEELIGSRLAEVSREVRLELDRLGQKVGELGRNNAEKFGAFDESLRTHAEVAATLADSTRSLSEALSSPQMRGQWGERMAEDVLRLAGFVENVNYRKQTQVDGGTGRPDFTFDLPKGHVLYMDVKFPLAAYLRYLKCGTDAERSAHLKRFLIDVRQRVKELAVRDYARESTSQTIDYVLLFLPNEQLTGFIYEHDPGLLDHAMEQRVVLCSPLTLFAFMGVIRQAFDNFMIEQTSDEILQLLATFSTQWSKYNESVDKVKRQFDSVERSFEELVGPRRRQLDRPLRQLDHLRLERGLAGPDELLTGAEPDDIDELDDAQDDPAEFGVRHVRQLGA